MKTFRLFYINSINFMDYINIMVIFSIILMYMFKNLSLNLITFHLIYFYIFKLKVLIFKVVKLLLLLENLEGSEECS